MPTARPRQLPSGTVIWRVQFRLDGKQRSETFTGKDAADSFAKLVERVGPDAALKTRHARDVPVRTAPTLREFSATYLDPTSGHLSGITEATRAEYGRIAERSFLPALGEMPIDAISKQDVARWVTWQEAQPSIKYPTQRLSAKTLRNYHGLLSTMLSAAEGARLVPGNVARGVRLTPGLRKGVTFITVDEFNRIHALLPAHYQPLAFLLAWTGLRWGEATALTWGDIDAESTVPTVRVTKAWKKGVNGRSVLGPPKTSKALRTVGVLPQVIDALGNRGPADQLIFVGEKSGTRLWGERFHKAAWQPALDRLNDEHWCEDHEVRPLGKRPRVHDLRHSHASWLIGDGAPLHYVQARLGHENITTTVGVYGHLLPDANAQLSQLMQARMSSAMPATVPQLRS